MSDHASFIIAAFAVAGTVLAVTVMWILIDHMRLKRGLTRFPAREGAALLADIAQPAPDISGPGCPFLHADEARWLLAVAIPSHRQANSSLQPTCS